MAVHAKFLSHIFTYLANFVAFISKFLWLKANMMAQFHTILKWGGGKYYPPLKNCVRMDGKEKNEWGKYRFNISKAGNLRAF